MKKLVFGVWIISLVVLLLSCASGSPASVAKSETGKLVKEQQAAAKESPQSEWDKVLEKAKKEGKDVLIKKMQEIFR